MEPCISNVTVDRLADKLEQLQKPADGMEAVLDIENERYCHIFAEMLDSSECRSLHEDFRETTVYTYFHDAMECHTSVCFGTDGEVSIETISDKCDIMNVVTPLKARANSKAGTSSLYPSSAEITASSYTKLNTSEIEGTADTTRVRILHTLDWHHGHYDYSLVKEWSATDLETCMKKRDQVELSPPRKYIVIRPARDILFTRSCKNLALSLLLKISACCNHSVSI